TLGFHASPRNRARDSSRLDIEVSFGPAAPARSRFSETKLEQIQILIVFQSVAASCQARTKKVQNGRDHGLSGLH
ncbi:hypothetical protein, partial [Mesorhizobium sp. M1E.F.Ca.ET.063.01.1.1]|uniref:hypothetical protein n=1 Tax=Mesorhizobium sp. M1E.F.Ca.ET.063.01.1.1 TaxID=2496750 RepID=UPI001AEC9C38